LVTWAAPTGPSPYTAFRVVRTDVTAGPGGATSTFVVSGSMNPLNGTIVAPATTFTDNNATPGHVYTYTVYAVNGPKVAPTGATSNAIPVLPFFTSASAVSVDPSQVTVSWSYPTTTGVTFQLTRQPAFTTAVTTLANSVSSYLDTTVVGGTQYTYTVQAKVGTAAGPSITATATTTAPVLTAPTGLTAAFTAPTTVSLSWADNAKGETGYLVERQTITVTAAGVVNATGAFTQLARTTTPNQTAFVDTTAAANALYVYRVTPVFGATNGTAATLTFATGALTATSTPTIGTVTSTSAVVNWTHTGGLPATSLQLQSSPDSASWTNVGAALVANATTTTVTGLTANTVYFFRVVASNSVTATTATSASSAQVTTPAATPATPAAPGVTAGSVTATGLTLSWAAATGATGYSLQYATVSAAGVVGTFAPVAANTATTGVRLGAALTGASTGVAITGLAGNTSYVFQLAVTTANGTSAFSASSATQLTVPATPAAPTLGLRNVITPTIGTLTWAAPTGTGTITARTLQYSTDNGVTWTTVTAATTVKATFVGNGAALTGLSNAFATTKYQFRLQTTNATGASAFSAASNRL
jgi:hypothetical protein